MMLRNNVIALSVVAGALLVSCSKDHGTEPGPFDVSCPPTPTDVSVTAGVEQATVEWDYPAGRIGAVEEFRVYYYFEAFDEVELAGTTTGLSYVDTRLVGNLEYCYRVSAVDTSGIEGWRTEEVCALIQTR
jgi:hypothetical protein